MSGTSLDGLDIAWCRFAETEGQWEYQILSAETHPYPKEIENRLRSAHLMSAEELIRLDIDYGNYCGKQMLTFSKRNSIGPDVPIASHGHTVFHRPDLGYTLQLGHGAAIAAASNRMVVCDFRTGDVALGGQGAPLVPAGDALLFPMYDACLNLGGFANISFEHDGQRKAFDICPVNFVLNHLARSLESNNRPEKTYGFDKGGYWASQGTVIPSVLNQLNDLSFYSQPIPRSLGREWVEQQVFPLLISPYHSDADLMHTFSEHAAIQIAICCRNLSGKRILVSGGGVYNSFLMDRLHHYTREDCIIEIPSDTIIEFREAMIFGFLGLLRLLGRTNCLSSVTGARKDHCTGSIFLGT